MPYLFEHLIGGWIAGKVIELSKKKRLSHIYWFVLLVGAIIPDLDFLMEWTWFKETHRTFTHSILFALFMGALLYLVFSFVKMLSNGYLKEVNSLWLGSLFTIGILTHLILDMFFVPGVPLLWPYNYYFSYFGIFPRSIIHEFAWPLAKEFKFALFDMAIGGGWILFLILWRKFRL